jgi:hypothetical protein
MSLWLGCRSQRNGIVETNTAKPEILKYQKGRTLDQCPSYTGGLQLRLTSGERVYIALSATELAVYFQPELAIHYDLEARLVKIAERHHYWRRGLSHRVVYSRKRPAEEGGGLVRSVLDESEADAMVAKAVGAVRMVYTELADGTATVEFGKPSTAEAREAITPLLARAAAFDVAAAHEDAARYKTLYGNVAVLPPNEYNAVVVQATEGCAYNHCTFCTLYHDIRYRPKPPDEFERHVRSVMDYHGQALRGRRSIFLGEANALMLPHNQLVSDLRTISSIVKLPDPGQVAVPASWWLGNSKQFDGVGSFMDVFTSKPRSVEQYRELRQVGLRRVYVGMESGDKGLLAFLNKPVEEEILVRTVTALKQARIDIGIIVLLGAGGKQFATAHARETARVINSLPLGRGDYIFLSPLIVYPNGPYDAAALEHNIEPLSTDEIDTQETELRGGLRFDPHRGRPYVARYELETFVY